MLRDQPTGLIPDFDALGCAILVLISGDVIRPSLSWLLTRLVGRQLIDLIKRDKLLALATTTFLPRGSARRVCQ